MSFITRKFLLGWVLLIAAALAVIAIFIWSGAYNIGADDPHNRPVHQILQTLRERSIETRASKLEVPADLMDSARIVQGAGNYDAMCTACHLSPGIAQTELSRGLYPAPPNLTTTRVDATSAFWVIKHGIKASGMPAWGLSMDDKYIWNMAAFLQALPDLDAARYQALVASSGGHSHGGRETMGHGDSRGANDDHTTHDHAGTTGAASSHQDMADHHHDATQGAPADEDMHEHADGHSHGNGASDSATPDDHVNHEHQH